MSTIRFKQDHGSHKAKSTVSVPFHTARDLVEKGIAEYPSAASPAPAVAKPTEFALLHKRNAELTAENDALREELRAGAEAVAEAKQLKKQVASLNADLEAARAETAAALKKAAETKK